MQNNDDCGMDVGLFTWSTQFKSYNIKGNMFRLMGILFETKNVCRLQPRPETNQDLELSTHINHKWNYNEIKTTECWTIDTLRFVF